MAIADKLTQLNTIKGDIKAAIIAKGGTATDDMTTYATAITNLPSGGGSDDDLKNLIQRSLSGSFEIPAGTTNIGVSAFNNCSRLTSVTIPNTVTTIGNQAFNGCSGLTSIIIPNSVINIYNNAFSYCSGLTSLTFLATTPPNITSTTFSNVPATCPIYVPAASVDTYKAANYWSARASYIQAIPSE